MDWQFGQNSAELAHQWLSVGSTHTFVVNEQAAWRLADLGWFRAFVLRSAEAVG